MKKLEVIALSSIVVVAFIVVGATGFLLADKDVEPLPLQEINITLNTPEENLSGSFSTDPETIIGIKPTSTAVSTYNTTGVGTTTPTTTSYFSLGPNVNKANINFIVSATSTDQKDFLYSYQVSGKSTASTTGANFYTLLPFSPTPTIATTTVRITLLDSTFWRLTIPLCSNTYDGTDNVPTCSTGLYRFQFGRAEDSGIEVYAEIDRE